MKYLLITIALISFEHILYAQQDAGVTKIYIVRHAERGALNSNNDPEINEAGKARAGDLLRALQNEGIQKIYVSQYRRTQMTADSLRITAGIDTVHYKADNSGDELINAIMQHSDFGKTILIIGHSNTIPKIIRKFGVLDYPQENIPDAGFDDLFLITYKNEKARVKKTKYGAESGVSAPMQ